MQKFIIRLFDLGLSVIGLAALSPLFVIIYIAGLFDTGSPLFFQERLGMNKKIFKLIKFRSMQPNAAQVGTHLANINDITTLGKILRRSKLDEIPQLINVILGDMSLVGPRPGLPTQKKLTEERSKRNVFNYKPGITGLGQIKEVDMSTPIKLSIYDQAMNRNLNLCLYGILLFHTITGKGYGDRVKQQSSI
ncbi:MAG: sugar transferase [Cellvibrionaceae bacterium]